MKTLIAIAMLSLITGCAEYGAVKSGIASHGAQMADEARTTAEWTLCDAITVGAWRRGYAGDQRKAAAWQALCAPAAAVPVDGSGK